MKKILKYMFRWIAATIISILLLSLFSLAYYHPPIAVVQPNGITNFKYIPDAYWTFMSEGTGYGKTDHLGYNNAYYPDCSDPDIVFAGSSHMEALQVPQDKNCVYLLNEKLALDDIADNDFKCLNLGISGHFFEVITGNFPYIAKEFKGAKYIVLEAFEVKYSSEMLDDMLEEKFHSPMSKRSWIYEATQRIPFFRWARKKIGDTFSKKNTDAEGSVAGESAPSQTEDMDGYTEKMNLLLGKIAELSHENGMEPIILLHERFSEDKDGNIVKEMDETYKNAFKACCKTNGVKVIDVSDAMVAAYKEDFAYSYGFSDGVPGEGHLNETGHRIIAETVYQYINEWEERK